MMKFSLPLMELMLQFEVAGHKIRVVGGAVRDHLLGEEPKDIDLCTDATPDEMEQLAARLGYKFLPTGVEHGTVTLINRDELFEVTTLRVDVETDGRRAEVEFTRSFELDAARRDLTFNAMSMDPRGKLYDYFNGHDDLRNNRVRFVGNADERVKEDYLRMLRYFRFAARFDAEFDLEELKVVTSQENLDGLKQVSVERYWLEMQKLLVAPAAENALLAMHYMGVLKTLGLDQPSMSVEKLDAVTSLATMLTPDTLDDFLSTWKLSAAEQKKLRFLVNADKMDMGFQEDVELLLMSGVDRDWVVSLCLLADAEEGLADYAAKWAVPVFPVTGDDLLRVGMKPGPELGEVLYRLKEAWMQSVMKQDVLSKAELMDMLGTEND